MACDTSFYSSQKLYIESGLLFLVHRRCRLSSDLRAMTLTTVDFKKPKEYNKDSDQTWFFEGGGSTNPLAGRPFQSFGKGGGLEKFGSSIQFHHQDKNSDDDIFYHDVRK